MFSNKMPEFPWNEQCSPKQNLNLHDMTNVHQTNISLHKMSKFTNINTWNSMKWAVFTTKKHMTSMKWAMFTKKAHDFSWNEQCSQQKTHGLPWNYQYLPKNNTWPSMKWAMFTKKTHYLLWNAQCPTKKTHYFSWICMKWPAKHWAISRAPGTRTNAISSAVEMGWWAVSFVGFDPMNIWRFLLYS